MEPRPSRPNRPASSSPRSQRAPWTPPEGSDDLTAPRSAEIYGQPPAGPSGGPGYGPHGSLGPEPPEYRATKPPMPIKPRGERGNKWLRYLAAAVLLLLVVGGGAAGVTWLLNDDDDDDGNQNQTSAQADATPAPESAAAVATETPETAAVPTNTPEQATEPTATAEPEGDPEESEPTPADEPAAEDEVDSADEEPAAQEVAASAADFLPEAAELDGSWTIFEEGERSREEVGGQLGENGEDLLASMRWRENLYRDFMLEDAGSLPDETTFLSVSVHRFGNAEGAQEALTVLSDIVIAAGYQETTPVDVGDAAVALQAPSDGANVYVLYVQDGNIVIRFGGSSVTGDPAAVVNAAAEKIVDGA